MSLVDTLMQSLGGDTMSQISKALGTDDGTAQNAAGAAVGALVGGMAKNASSGNGAEDLLGALSRDHDGSTLDNVGSVLGDGGEAAGGAGILGHVFGGKQAGVQGAISQSTGLDSGSVGKLMMMVAPLVMGALGKQAKGGGMDAGKLTELLGQEKTELARREPKGMGMLQGILDADGDGDVDMGDILKKGSGLLGKFLKG